MALVEIDWHPGDRQLRQFGLCSLACAVLLGVVALIRSNGGHVSGLAAIASWRIITPVALGGAVALVGLIRPRWLRPVYLGLTVATFPIGWCVSYLVLVFVFVALFTPIAIVFRLLGRDALHRRIDRTRPTYWRHRRNASSPASYLRQS